MGQHTDRILELRIHGMNNTAPHDLLEVAQGDIELSQGDSLGSFWTPTAEAVARARQHAQAEPNRAAPADVPDGVRREAYSWGPMARTSPSQTAAGPKPWLSIAIRAGWMMLIPFGLANGAYWTRRLLARSDGKVQYGRGAALVRLFGYGLTLLGVCAIEAVSCWELATWRLAADADCVGAPLSSTDGCRPLPQWFDSLAGLTWLQRMAVGSLVPVLVLVGLWWLSRGANLRYEKPTSTALPDPRGAPRAHDPSILADPSMWTRWRLTGVSARAHLAGGVGLVTMFAATSGGWSLAQECQTAPQVLGSINECLMSPGSAFGASQLVLAALALVVVVSGGAVVAWLSAVRVTPTARSSRLTAWLLGVALAAFVLELWLLWTGPTTVPRDSVPGLNITQGILLIALLLIAVSGLTWRSESRWARLVPLLGLALTATVIWLMARPSSRVALWFVIVAASAFIVVCLSLHGDRSKEAWMGRGPGVFLLLALGAAAAGASVLVVAVGDWLNGSSAVTDLFVGGLRTDTTQSTGRLLLPNTYVETAVASALAFVLVLVMILGYIVWMSLTRRLRVSKQPDDAPTESLGDAVQRARRVAALSQRATWVVGVIAVAVGVALTLAVVLSVDDSIHTRDSARLTLVEHAWFGPVASIGLWTNSFVWAALLVRVLLAQDSPGRPVALVWDLLCFLPRAGHPLAPPCYAERAVPELAARIQAWTSAEPPRRREDRAVVLAAHSLGAVLAVATVLAMDEKTRSKVALLTFGTQLRPYFGRILPELLGPDVLGSESCEPHNWRGLNVWSDKGRPPSPQHVGVSVSVGSPAHSDPLPRWINLWRATDPLGMPAVRVPKPAVDQQDKQDQQDQQFTVDRAAGEIDRTKYLPLVATHSNYPRTKEYHDALSELIGLLEHPHKPVGPPARTVRHAQRPVAGGRAPHRKGSRGRPRPHPAPILPAVSHSSPAGR